MHITKLHLHHGAVHNAKTDIGFQISNDHVTTDLFEGHDLTLLGDIHKPAQFLNKEKTIGYPGSLIQQNHGEVFRSWNFSMGSYQIKHQNL